MRLGSLFDGIGGWLIAAERAGVTPLWASEIDQFPSAVSAYHFPDVKQLGDITKIDVNKLESVDIICAGSPCQDLSVSGKREGLAGVRSGLFNTAIELVHRLRERTGKPRYFVWENVCGAFSTNKGHDFRTVLEKITKTEIPMPAGGRWAESGMVEWNGGSLAWRVLDAQYWGVPQRRKRVFLVADFGGYTAGKILFERESVSRYSAESEETRKEIATDVGTSVDNASETLITCYNVAQPSNNFISRMGAGENKVPIVHCYDTQRRSDVCREVKGNISPTLLGACGTGGGNVPMIAFEDRHDEGVRLMNDGKCNTLRAAMGEGGGIVPCVTSDKTVRRLTPLECERLQGLPKSWTDVEFNGKSAPDSRRYKAIGNGMAQPCADYIIRRIVEVSENE